MSKRELAADCLVIALGIILVIHFILFWVSGGVYIFENNHIILSIETAMAVGIIILGIERFVDDIRRIGRDINIRIKKRSSNG